MQWDIGLLRLYCLSLHDVVVLIVLGHARLWGLRRRATLFRLVLLTAVGVVPVLQLASHFDLRLLGKGLGLHVEPSLTVRVLKEDIAVEQR